MRNVPHKPHAPPCICLDIQLWKERWLYAVPEARRVTPYWVELSIDVGSPVTQLGKDRVTCKPLPYPLPLPGMADVKCALLP